MKNKGLIITLISIGAVLLIGFIMSVSISNKEIRIRTATTAKQKECEAYYDKVWKILAQKAGVVEKYKTDFKDIYVPLIQGRYSNDNGLLMKWITEHNPQFKSEMYEDLMRTIESERTGFFFVQKQLIDMKASHDMFIKQFPNSLFVGKRPEIQIVVITSEKTENVYKTGKEDNIELFK